MKKIISTLLSSMLLTATLSAQVSFILDYDYMEYLTANNTGADYGLWVFPINNANNLNTGGGNWAEVRFDSLVEFDYDTGTVLNTYQLAESTIRIDSFGIGFAHVNHSGTNNTITVSIYQGGAPTDSSTHSGTMIWTRAINTTTSLSDGRQSNGLPKITNRYFYPGITLPKGEHFSIRLNFSGSVAQDTFYAIASNSDFCNDACKGGRLAIIPNASSFAQGSFDGYLMLPGVHSLYHDCSGNSAYDANQCEEFFAQNFYIWSYVTLTSAGYDMSMGGTHTTCTGIFYDSGGPDESYGSFEDNTITFTSATPGQQISMSFLQFSLYYPDELKVYDGTTTAHPLIGAYDGNFNPFEITSPSGSLTFRFTSDGSNESDGWRANISCVSSPVAIDNRNSSHALIGNVSIYPNPNEGNFILQIEGYDSQEPLTLELFTPDARRIYEEIIPAQTDIRKSMELLNLNEGLYLLRISNKTEQMLEKIISR